MKDATELLVLLRSKGIEVQADGNRLRFRPADALTPDELELLRAHKAEIIRLLTTPLPIDPAHALHLAHESRAAWAGAMRELAELAGWPELPFKSAHRVAPGPIPWGHFVRLASIADMRAVLTELQRIVANLGTPKKGSL
ncbi:MAG: hypothetical protein FJ315_03330 [SAR202 cluster bacterium]|nr:hypothetical protein [SAR202 cluster bacterium]